MVLLRSSRPLFHDSGYIATIWMKDVELNFRRLSIKANIADLRTEPSTLDILNVPGAYSIALYHALPPSMHECKSRYVLRGNGLSLLILLPFSFMRMAIYGTRQLLRLRNGFNCVFEPSRPTHIAYLFVFERQLPLILWRLGRKDRE